MSMFGETLPYRDNRATLHAARTDNWGIPLLHLDCHGRENERKMMLRAAQDAEDMLIAGGCTNVTRFHPDPEKHIQLGLRIHEMGGACMGEDPREAVTNKWGQLHDAPNVFVTDGACMSSCGTVNPSLTYMAITARAADHAARLLQEHAL